MAHREQSPRHHLLQPLGPRSQATDTKKPWPQLSTQSDTVHVLLVRKNHLTGHRQTTNYPAENKYSALGTRLKTNPKAGNHPNFDILCRNCYGGFFYQTSARLPSLRIILCAFISYEAHSVGAHLSILTQRPPPELPQTSDLMHQASKERGIRNTKAREFSLSCSLLLPPTHTHTRTHHSNI